MAVNLQGWVTPENEMKGLHGLADDLRRNTANEQRLQEGVNAKKASNTKFFANYLDDKAKFTGTKYDPYTHELTSQALNQAMDLINQGADTNDVLAAIGPLVNKVDKYTLNAQQYAKNRDEVLKHYSNVKGIDLDKFKQGMDRQAFEGKDISEVDPTVNYADLALKNEDVFNEEGFDEAFLKAPKNTTDAKMVSINSKGGRETSKVKLTAPYYAISEKDKEDNHIGFVPKYQIATDNGNEIIHQFETENGNVNAAIRLYDKELFDALPPNEKGYLVQEARKYAKAKGADLSAPQMENFARALAYDLKKSRINGSYVHSEETKENPAPRITVNVGKPTATEKREDARNDKMYKTLDNRPIDKDGEIDVTDIFNAVAVIRKGDGTKINQGSISYNPNTKKITYFDGERKQTKPIYEVATIATPANPNSDVSMISALENYERKSDLKKEDTLLDKAKAGIGSFFNPKKAAETKTAKPKADPLGIF